MNITTENYTDQRLFPLTTQPGLTWEQQQIRDIANLSELEEATTPLDRRELAVLRELKYKQAAWPSLSNS